MYILACIIRAFFDYFYSTWLMNKKSFQSVPLWPQKADVFHFSKFNVSVKSDNTWFPLSLTLSHKVCYVQFLYILVFFRLCDVNFYLHMFYSQLQQMYEGCKWIWEIIQYYRIMNVHDEGYSRNAPGNLNYISKLIFPLLKCKEWSSICIILQKHFHVHVMYDVSISVNKR